MTVRTHRLRKAVTALTSALLAFATAAAQAVVAVRDDTGVEVRLPAPAVRVVSLAPHVTELLFALGAGNRIVAATAYSDYPDAAKAIPRVGGLSGIDLESLVAAKPDLVVAWQSGTSAAQIDAIARLGIPVFRSEPHKLADVASTLRRLGTLTGRDPTAAVADFDTKIDRLRSSYSGRAPVRVFYQVWNRPLMTIGGPQLISEVIALCGGRNVFAGLSTLAPIVDAEAVIAADPQLIVTSAENTDHRADEAAWSRWTGVSAVRTRSYLFLDPAVITRHTPRIAVGAETLCRAIDAVRTR